MVPFCFSFFAFHTVLKTSKDYYEALRWSRALADNITEMIDTPGTNVFAYSIFYVFYEQYLTIVEGQFGKVYSHLTT